MPGNIRSIMESNTMWTVTTITAIRILAHTRMETALLPQPDAQFAEPTAIDV